MDQFNIDDFTAISENYYETIKSKLEGSAKGKYAALDASSQNYWIGETASDALAQAKREFPEKLFYVVLVGSPTTFVIQSVRRHETAGLNNALYGHRRMD